VVDEELIKLVFVGTADNLSDGMTKNVTREVYEATSGAYISVRDYWNISQITPRKGVGDHDSAVTEMIRSTHKMIHSNERSVRVGKMDQPKQALRVAGGEISNSSIRGDVRRSVMKEFGTDGRRTDDEVYMQ
jgi:hypothetical protein